MTDIRCIVAGSRDCIDYAIVATGCDKYLRAAGDRGISITIISGTARGVDRLGERYAQENGLECVRYPADWDRHGRSAGYKRNELMAKNATHLIAFWDGQSRGTMHMINLAGKAGLIVRVVKFTPPPPPTAPPKQSKGI